ncbi:uncharacterized protein LOC119724758 [Patiria miniata]|uniref:Uncharacterized protein n=1 Tax=Patiria miniata TaxID=46514 RepID=A0A913ZKP3_PATMI|nr:uncharacterized protein LOC119724758 [Patiria miniata]
MEEPIQLTTFGKPKLNNASTEATPNGIDTAAPNTKVDTVSNNNLVVQPKDASGCAGETKECNSVIHETAIDIPEPPPPPPIQSSAFDQPQSTSTVGTEATADIIDTDTPISKDAESISAGTAEKEQAVAPVAAANGSPGNEESNSVAPEKELSSTPTKFSTFSPPLSVIAETHETTPDVQGANKDETPKPAEEPKGALGTSATQQPLAPSTGDTATTTSLSKEAEARPGADQSKSSPEPDDPAGLQNVASVAVLDKGQQSIEIELGPAADELGPAPVVLMDEAVESNSLDSGMKLASFDAELDTMFVKGEENEPQRCSRTRFVVLCSMAIATVMLLLVAVGLVLLMTYEDISKILGESGKPTITMQRVVMLGEDRIKNLQFSSSYDDPTSESYKSLQRQFINSIDEAFKRSPYSGVYRSTSVSKFRNGSVIVVFSVLLKPMKTPRPSEDQTSGRRVYEEAKKFLRKKLRSVMIDETTYNVSNIKLTLMFGSESVTEEPPTTRQPQMSTIQISPSHVTTARDQTTITTDGYQSTEMSSTADQTTASMMPATSDQTGTTRASTSAAPLSTSDVTNTFAMNQMTTLVTRETMTTANPTTVTSEQRTDSNSTGVMTTEITLSTTMNGTTRRKRSTRFTDMSTTRLVTKQSSSTLPVSLTPKMTDDVTEGCFPNPYQTCVLLGLSPNVTRTPNRFGLGHNTSQIWSQFNNEVMAGMVRDFTTWRVICSLLAPSCDGSLIGPTLPCRSACLALVGSLRDTVETRTLGALCNESLPESESGTICFKLPNQDQTNAPPNGGLCSALSCQNGGSCFEMNNGAYCRCPEGFGGRRCDIDPCSPNPCQNGAMCRGHAEFIISYVCGCQDGYQGTHCELSTAEPLPSYTPKLDVHVPVEIDEPGCRDLLPYNQSFSDTKVPDWRVVAPLASCSDEARLIFCAMAYPEFEPRRRRAPCSALCERVFAECDAFFTVMGRDFPGICERLGTIPTAVANFCTGPHP